MSEPQAPRSAAAPQVPQAPSTAAGPAGQPPAPPTPLPPAARRRGLAVVAGLVVLGAAAYTAYWALALRHFEHTDNAYVQGNVVQITPQIGGTVLAILADETDTVRAGQPLVRLDPADAQVALEQAEAQLGQTVREVRTLYANNQTLAAQAKQREADLGRLQADAARWQADLARREPLLASGAIGREEVEHARSQLKAAQGAVAAAQSALAAAREQLASNQSLTAGTSVAEHPNVQRAAARLRETWLATQRAALPAPIGGVVAKRAVQVGQRVQPGAPLMTVVALDNLWVDANFKEAQLARLRVGQPATLVADVYGDKVIYHGRVAGLGAGTGSAFALLPAQNATGNWIKVTQRVPVRVTLDAAELAKHPLRVGLSMTVQVDVADAGGAPVAAVAAGPASAAGGGGGGSGGSGGSSGKPVAQTAVFDAALREADARVRQIVAANLAR